MTEQNIYLYHLFVLIMFFSYYEFLDSIGVDVILLHSYERPGYLI